VDGDEGSNAETSNDSINDEDAVYALIQHILKCHLKENKELQGHWDNGQPNLGSDPNEISEGNS
jgi:hypothetical protein